MAQLLHFESNNKFPENQKSHFYSLVNVSTYLQYHENLMRIFGEKLKRFYYKVQKQPISPILDM